MAWEQTTEYPGLLIREDFKFIRDRVLNSKLVQIEAPGSGAGTNVSSFNCPGSSKNSPNTRNASSNYRVLAASSTPSRAVEIWY